MAGPISGRSVWTGDELARANDWIMPWPDGAVEAIDGAFRAAAARGLVETAIRQADFPLPGLAPFFAAVLAALEDGRGVVRITGFPVARYTVAELRSIFWGIGTHLGTAVYQTAQGEIIGAVRDETRDDGIVSRQVAAKRQGSPEVLASRARARSTGPLRFHTDRCDVIALLCASNGIAGGVSKLASIPHIHNEILRRRPDLHALLCQDYWRVRPEDEDGPGRGGVYALPVFGQRDGKLTCQYSRTYVEQAQERADVPRLSAAQNEALDLLAEIAEASCLHAPFAEGDIQLLNNHVVFHGRTAYEDAQGSGKSRLLLRLWLSVANSRALPEGYERLWGSTAAGALRGGVTLRDADRRSVA